MFYHSHTNVLLPSSPTTCNPNSHNFSPTSYSTSFHTLTLPSTALVAKHYSLFSAVNYTNMNTLALRYRVLSPKHYYSCRPSVFQLSFQQAPSRTQQNRRTHLPSIRWFSSSTTQMQLVQRPPERPGLLLTHFDKSS